MNRESLYSVFNGARTLIDITDKIRELRNNAKRKKAQAKENGILAPNTAQTFWKMHETQMLIEAIHEHGKNYDKLTEAFDGSKTRAEVMEKVKRLLVKLPNLKEAFVTKK